MLLFVFLLMKKLRLKKAMRLAPDTALLRRRNEVADVRPFLRQQVCAHTPRCLHTGDSCEQEDLNLRGCEASTAARLGGNSSTEATK